MNKITVYKIILITIALKIALCGFLELGNDEVYYLTYARQWQWNYFDHPPFVALILKFFSANLLLKHEIFLRLGFIACGAISALLIFKIAKKFYGETEGFIAVLLFSASVYGNIISGFMIMPDGPMLLFWLCSFYYAVKIMKQENTSLCLLLFGLFAGLAIMSKVSAVMLWVGLGLFILMYRRSLLNNKYLYIAILISALIASPILFWNMSGAAYHAGRVAINNTTDLNFNSFLRQILGEIGYNNPILYALTITGIVYNIKRRKTTIASLVLCFALPLIVMVWSIAMFRDTLPHWTGPSYILLLFFAAPMLANSLESTGKISRTIYGANGLVIMALLVIVLGARFLPYSFNNKDADRLGSGDLFLDFSGWKEFGSQFKTIYQADKEKNIMKPRAALICDKWFPAAHIDWYVAGKNGYPFLATGKLNDIHQYAWLNETRQQLKQGDDAYYIRVSNYFTLPDSTLLNFFETADPELNITQQRSQKAVRNFQIVRLHSYKGGIPTNGLIHE